MKEKKLLISIGCLVCFFLLIVAYFLSERWGMFSVRYDATVSNAVTSLVEEVTSKTKKPLDKALFDKKMKEMANNPVPPVVTSSTSTIPAVTPTYLWPAKAADPLGGALLPFNRIVAYYGNFYSTQMGVLGEYPSEEMLRRLKEEVGKWKVADPSTPVIPAIHYIAVTAQGAPGADGMYRLRMPDTEIDKAIKLADQVNGLVFVDIQVGLSTFEKEIPRFEKYLKMAQVHLALDPEFSMKTGKKPGTVIGTMDATDINYATSYLARLVTENNLPPKILVIHRFTQNMVTNYKNIKTVPEVQIVMDMDGWGPPPNKINTYKSFIFPEPVQFTGFKLFYKNDIKNGEKRMLTPNELLKLRPRPMYIQYQ